MPDLTCILDLIPRLLPFECMEARFMQLALLGLILLVPMAAVMGVQVVNFRMSFFADAISHSTFTGIAIGLLFSVNPHWTTPVFAVVLGLGIMLLQRKTSLPTDAVIGVFLAGVVAFGIAMVSRDPNLARDVQRFLYGDILTIGEGEVVTLMVMAVLLVVFKFIAFNKLLYIGINPTLANVHRVKVAAYQYLFAAFLAVLVVFAVRAAGVILAPGLFIIPASAARNLSKSAGRMVWWSLGISISAAIIGFLISAQPWARTATGATVVLVAFFWFLVSAVVTLLRREPVR